MPPLSCNSNRDIHADALLERGLLVAVVLACGLALSKDHADPDLWGHVQYGRDMLRDGLPETCTYSYTAAGYPWINHEILSELALAWSFDTLGASAMLLGKCLLGVGIIAAVLRHARRRGVDALIASAVALLVALNMMLFWSMRPQLASYALFTLLLLLLEWCFAGWRNDLQTPLLSNWSLRRQKLAPECEPALQQICRRGRLPWLWLAFPLLVIWANSHGGFVAGLCVLGAYLGGRSVEAALILGRRSCGMIMRFGLVLAACVLATFVNPYGSRLHAWLAMSLGTARPEIVEWLPPELNAYWLQFWLLAAVALIAAVFTRRRRDVTQLAILALVLWQATEHRRHIVFFAILFGFWLPQHVESAVERVRRLAAPNRQQRCGAFAGVSPLARRGLALVLAAACLLICCGLVSQCSRIVVRREGYPVAAFQYMADQKLNGKLVVAFRWAQYAIAAFGSADDPGNALLVQFDGRFRTCYPQHVVDMYFDFALDPAGDVGRSRSPHSPPLDRGRVLRYRRPDLALVYREMPASVEVMQQHAGQWVLLYQDQIAQLWGRADKYDDPASPDYLPPKRRRVTEEKQQGVVAWPALPTRTEPERRTDWKLADTRLGISD